MIYFDSMASTSLDPKVAQCMRACAEDAFANPSAPHPLGQQAHALIDRAATRLSDVIHCDPTRIYWTSGATEANNWAIWTAQHYARQGKHVVTMATEHVSVLAPCQHLQSQGFRVTYLKPEANGVLSLDKLKSALCPDTVLVSIMMVNNETGVVQPVEEITSVVHQHGALMHVDAVQAPGKVPLDVRAIDADMLTLSAHKLHGPKGVGALVASDRVHIKPMIMGGSQQGGQRGGTLATPLIVGMAEAFVLMQASEQTNLKHMIQLRDRLWSGIQDLPGLLLNGDFNHQVPHCINLCFAHIDGRALLHSLKGCVLTQASACLGESIQPSHVLLAMGRSATQASRSIRIGLDRQHSKKDIDQLIDSLRSSVLRLDQMAVKDR